MMPVVGPVLTPATPAGAVAPLLPGDFLGALLAVLGQGAAAPITARGAQHAADGGDEPARAEEPRHDPRDLDVAPIIVAAMPGGAWGMAPASFDVRLAGTQTPDIRTAETPTAEPRTAAVVPMVPEIVRLPRLPAAEPSGEARGVTGDQGLTVSEPPGVRFTGTQAPDIRTAETPTAEPRPAAVVIGYRRHAEPGALALPSPDAMNTDGPALASSSPVPVAQEPASPAAADPSPARGSLAPTPLDPTAATGAAGRALSPRTAAPADARLASVPTRDRYDIGRDATGDERLPHADAHARPAAVGDALASLAPRGPERRGFEAGEDGARGDGRERGEVLRVAELDGHAAVPAAPPRSHPERPAHVGGPADRPDGGHAPRAGEPSVVDQMVASVRLIRRDGRHELTLRLDPPELGAVRIAATLDGRHLTLDIRVDQEPARVILERSLPQLRESLAEQGLDTDRVTVQLGLPSSGREPANGGTGAWRMPAPPAPVARAVPAAPVLPSRHDTGHAGIDLWV